MNTDSVTTFPSKGQAMAQPWTHGPLDPALEQMALKLFEREYPLHLWPDPLLSPQRNDCRRFVLQMREAFTNTAWGVKTAEDTLTEGTIHLLTGGRPVSDQTRHELRQYAQSYLEDLMPVFGAQVQRELDRKVS